MPISPLINEISLNIFLSLEPPVDTDSISKITISWFKLKKKLYLNENQITPCPSYPPWPVFVNKFFLDAWASLLVGVSVGPNDLGIQKLINY